MKKCWLLVLCAGFLSSCAGNVALGPPREVGVAEAQKLVASGQAVPIDMRSPREYVGGHVPGAVLVPFGSSKTAKQVRKAMGGKQGVIYCRTGRRSEIAMTELSSIPGMLHLQGGITAWKAARAPLETGMPGVQTGPVPRRPVYEEHRTEVYDFL